MNNQTVMQQLLNQLKEERLRLPLSKDWENCYLSIESMIEKTYIRLEKAQIVIDYSSGHFDCVIKEYKPNEYFNKMYGGEEK